MTYTRYFFEKRFKKRYIESHHHTQIGEVLNRVYAGEITRLMINIFPRSGKTELAVKNFISCGFAINPASKFIHLTYSNELALDNSESIRDDFIRNEEHQKVFPYLKIRTSSTAKNKWYTTAGGGIYSVATGGAITGFGAGEIDNITDRELQDIDEFIPVKTSLFNGAILIDDPLKPDDAFSDTLREKINRRYLNTIKSRINSIHTPIIIIGQRLHPNDFCGFILDIEGKKEDGGEWDVLSIPSLYVENGEYKSIWESKMPVTELLKLKESDEYTFESQYQQNPVSEKGKLFPKSELSFYNPELFKFDKTNYSVFFIDPADRGDDFAGVFGYLLNGIIYIDDIICNNTGLEYNIPASIDLALNKEPSYSQIEGNGGWIQTAKDIRSGIWAKNENIDIRIINETKNKEEKIASQAYFIKKRFCFRSDYEKLPQYKKSVDMLTKYMKGVKDQRDDIPDVLANVSIYLRRNGLLEQ